MPITHTVEEGECLASIAGTYGFADVKTIYDHPDNAELRGKRPNPNLIRPGDVVVIPDRKQKKVPCASGAKHRFEVRAPPTRLRLVLKDDEGHPLANKKYELRAGRRMVEGTTDGDGLVDQSIPAEARQGELRLFLGEPGETEHGYVFQLELGSLGPAEGVRGAQARLENLGYDCGGVTGTMDEQTAEAIAAFQEKHKLQATGTLDETTMTKLREQHDGG